MKPRSPAPPAWAVAAAAILTHCTITDAADPGGDGLFVEVEVAARPGPTSWAAGDGAEFQLSRGFVALATVEIVACPDAAEASRGWSLIGVAHAHSQGSPRKLGVPAALPFTPAEALAHPLGTLGPPPARYCHVRVGLGPADGDAELLPEDAPMVGRTLWLEGTVVRGGEAVPFELQSTATRTLSREVSFELAEGTPTSRVIVELSVERLAASLAASDLSANDAGERALDAAAESLLASAR